MTNSKLVRASEKLKKIGLKEPRPLGLKLYRVTDQTTPLKEKKVYEPNRAKLQAQKHAKEYLQGRRLQLNQLSKSSAAHSTLIIDDNSSCKFIKSKDRFILKTGLKITQKNSVFEKNYWKISAAHDRYLKKFKSIHERNIEFFPEQMKFVGNDKIIRKKNNYNFKFDIRFHLEPNIKLMKTQDNKSILIELKDEGWKFTCDNYEINIDNGLYFGNKNSYIENQNIFVSGILNNNEENIKWEIKKI